jgi:hypothetical protein
MVPLSIPKYFKLTNMHSTKASSKKKYVSGNDLHIKCLENGIMQRLDITKAVKIRIPYHEMYENRKAEII